MKKTIIVLTIAFFGWQGIANGQQPATVNMQPKTDSLYILTAGHVAMTIDASFGGRIRSLRYDDREVLSQTRWPESFGSTFWTSPQSEWNWPPVAEIDKGAYTVEQADRNTVTMISQPSRRLGIAVTKRFTAADDGTSISVTYTISNVGSAERRVAPWEITRVPNGGLISSMHPCRPSVPPVCWPSSRLMMPCGTAPTQLAKTVRLTPMPLVGLPSPTTDCCSSRNSLT